MSESAAKMSCSNKARLESRISGTKSTSLAARYNLKLLRALEAALKKEPEADIASLLPSNYSATLQSHKMKVQQEFRTLARYHSLPDDDIRSRISITDSCTVLFELSPMLQDLLQKHENLSTALFALLVKGESIYKSAWTAAVAVLKISPDIAVKITNAKSSMTEIQTLAYLQQNLPAFPAPIPHGLVRFGQFELLFVSFVTGLDLEKVWCRLPQTDKMSISRQLDQLLSQLRRLPHPPNTPFGGVKGEGCKDVRRSFRVSDDSIMDGKHFEDFVFAGSRRASPLFLRFLRDLKPETSTRGVFTHGDIRPANIMVCQGEDSTWKIIALIDWENSGFYPPHWECVKMTNNLTLTDDDDWYLYLPESLSPRRYPIDWLIDRVLDRSLEQS